MGIGDWGLGIGDWGLGGWGQTPKTQTPNPRAKTQFLFLLLFIKIFL